MTVTDWPEPLVYDETEDLAGGYGRAVFNEARTHRYLLERHWREGKPLTWVMLNPSTADAFADDPTIRRCIRFAQRDGFAGIRVVNLFGLRATDPRDLRAHPDPVGPCNDQSLREAAGSGDVVAAWGAGGRLACRGDLVAAGLAAAGVDLACLAVTKDGNPVHPLARGRSRVPDDAPFTADGRTALFSPGFRALYLDTEATAQLHADPEAGSAPYERPGQVQEHLTGPDPSIGTQKGSPMTVASNTQPAAAADEQRIAEILHESGVAADWAEEVTRPSGGGDSFMSPGVLAAMRERELEARDLEAGA